MISLPPRAGRFELRSFWLICAGVLAGAVLALGWRFNIFFTISLGVIMATAFYAIVLAREPFARRLYHAWNRRLVHPLTSTAAYIVMGICFFIIFAITGRLGSRFYRKGNADTTWTPRDALPSDAYLLPFASQGELLRKARWIRGYIHWATRSGNAWALSLIPFLWLLRLLSSEERERTEGNIYTLF